MNNKKILIPAFLLVVLVQLYVPAKMILDRENILEKGKEYKFKTAPIDPTDPFRGKYITLRYSENTVEVPNNQEWMRGEIIYVSVITDTAGFATIKSVSKEKPTENHDFIKAKVSFISGNDSTKLTIDYPFDRFYMEESKAYDAELTYRESQRENYKPAYALVNIKDGDVVLKDVLIEGTPIREIVKKNRESKN